MVRRAAGIVILGLVLALPALAGAPARARPLPAQSRAVLTDPVTSLAVDAADGSLLTVAGGLLRSSDHGKNWQPLALPDAAASGQLTQVATSTAAPQSLFVAGPGAGILRSDDRGVTWRPLSDRLLNQEVAAFAVHSNLPDTLYAWIAGQGVYRTEDSGGTWELMDEGPPGAVSILAHSTLEGSMNTGWLYAATPDGPYLSMDCF